MMGQLQEEIWATEAWDSLKKFENTVEIDADFLRGYIEGRKKGKVDLDNYQEMFKAFTLKNSKSLSGQLVEVIEMVNEAKKLAKDNELRILDAVEYLSNYTEFTIAAKTLSLLLRCDFRDSKSEAEKYLRGINGF